MTMTEETLDRMDAALNALDGDTELSMCWDRHGLSHDLRWLDFVSDNRESSLPFDEIAGDLVDGGEYLGGGGACPEWSLTIKDKE